MSLRKKIARAGLFVVLALSIVTLRVVWSSRSEWNAAEQASGDDQIVRLGRAARLYAPGNPYSRHAFDALAALGRDDKLAPSTRLAAWRELRASSLATRSFYTPYAVLLDEANRAIAAEMARTENPALAPNASEAERRAWHAERLAMDEAPNVGWTLLALLGFFAWVGAAFVFIHRGLDDDDRLRQPWALWCAVAICTGLVAFFLGLARA